MYSSCVFGSSAWVPPVDWGVAWDTATGILPAEQPMRHKNWARWWFHFLIYFHPYLGWFNHRLVGQNREAWRALATLPATLCAAVPRGAPPEETPYVGFWISSFLYLAEALRAQPHKTGGILGIPSGQFDVEKTRWMFFLKPSFKRGPTKIIIKPSRLELCSWNFFTVFLGGGFQLKYLLFSSITGGKMNPIWRAYVSNGLVQPPTSFFVRSAS